MLTGVDISTWQQPHDYNALARSVDFVILKAGGSNTGSRYVDSKYVRHASALSGKTRVGAYWMNGAGTAAADADFFLRNLRGDTQACVVLDIETIDGYRYWSPAKSAEWFSIVRSALPGVPAFAYMNTNVAESADWRPLERSGVKLWLANYGRDDGTLSNPNPGVGTWSSWAIHQYTQRGTVPGVSGGIDLNRARENAFHTPSSGEPESTAILLLG